MDINYTYTKRVGVNYSFVFILLFLVELLILFLFSRSISRSLGQIFYNLTKSHKGTIYLLAVTFLPGTVVHELAHAISAGVMMVHVGSVEFMPQVVDGGNVKLGSAQIGHTDPIRRALIGVAPIWVGLGLILLILGILESGKFNVPWWGYAVAALVVFEITNTMFSSSKDMEGFWKFGLLVFAVSVGLYFVGLGQVFGIVGNFFGSEAVGNFFRNAAGLLFVPIILDFLIYGLAKFVLRR